MSKVWSMRLGAACGVAAIAISVLAEGDGSAGARGYLLKGAERA